MTEQDNRKMSIIYEPSRASSESSCNAELNTSLFVDTRQLIEMLQCSVHDDEEADDSKEMDCVDLGTRFENAALRPKIDVSDVAGLSYQAPGERVSFVSGGWMYSNMLPSSVSGFCRYEKHASQDVYAFPRASSRMSPLCFHRPYCHKYA